MRVALLLLTALLSGCEFMINNNEYESNISGIHRVIITNVKRDVFRHGIRYHIEVKDVCNDSLYKINSLSSSDSKNVKRENFVRYLTTIGSDIYKLDTITVDFSNYIIINN